jgi:hypothetical protein
LPLTGRYAEDDAGFDIFLRQRDARWRRGAQSNDARAVPSALLIFAAEFFDYYIAAIFRLRFD